MGKRHSPEQIVRKLRQAEARLAAEGSSVSVVQQFHSNQTTANVKRPPELVITFN
jgi:hypothetical protein